ncbi:hypothetical protein Back11_25190 [Paenibacillus baekrokdamisoli]|uniref:Uncharacterized protein n=1 Tax=Paenibacillus baekrokdamisoli TaxID=1712516 RepID=A0A3G9JDD3_9BACL|nr:S-layer homology domain-containing protein [Paenibacillus baekrokdamisoli]MBB3070167.1 hypothetical protein [Paenibacillus baekrokdamisoli]BBH21174.1 hypothetical protein Back11_25190 [Paenibacillus baekrokdamisoli]
MKKTLFLFSVVVLVFAAISQSVWAFSDTKNDTNETKISALQELGILSGSKDGSFKPKDKLTYASGISIVVKGLGLNIDNLRFVKQPLASDSFPKAKNDAWYSDSLVIAAYNGLDLPKDLDPSAVMTREQFAHLLFRGIEKTGDYAFPEIYALLNDEAAVSTTYMDSIQKLLTISVIKLDAKNNFNPKLAITRGEAAGWLYDAAQFVKKNASNQPAPGTKHSFPLSDLTLSIKAITPEVNEVTITAQAPNSGYGMHITSLTFDGDQAVIDLEPTFPKPGMMYLQVITKVKVVTYVASNYKPVFNSSLSSVESSMAGSEISILPALNASTAEATIH